MFLFKETFNFSWKLDYIITVSQHGNKPLELRSGCPLGFHGILEADLWVSIIYSPL